MWIGYHTIRLRWYSGSPSLDMQTHRASVVLKVAHHLCGLTCILLFGFKSEKTIRRCIILIFIDCLFIEILAYDVFTIPFLHRGFHSQAPLWFLSGLLHSHIPLLLHSQHEPIPCINRQHKSQCSHFIFFTHAALFGYCFYIKKIKNKKTSCISILQFRQESGGKKIALAFSLLPAETFALLIQLCCCLNCPVNFSGH